MNLSEVITFLFACLIIIAIIDVGTMFEIKNKYEALAAQCPCYNGTQLNAPVDNYTGAVYVNNGIIAGRFDPVQACRELRR